MARISFIVAVAALCLCSVHLAQALPASGRALLAASDACIYTAGKCIPSAATVITSKAPATDADKCAVWRCFRCRLAEGPPCLIRRADCTQLLISTSASAAPASSEAPTGYRAGPPRRSSSALTPTP